MIGNIFAKLARRCSLGESDNHKLEQEIAEALQCDQPFSAPRFTKSIDAAIRLIPPHWYRVTTQQRYGLWLVQLWRANNLTAQPDVNEHGITEALATAAAGLQALSILQEELEWNEL